MPASIAVPAPLARPASWALPRLRRGWLRRLLARLAENDELLALGDRELRDIGLTRDEAVELAAKPPWRT